MFNNLAQFRYDRQLTQMPERSTDYLMPNMLFHLIVLVIFIGILYVIYKLVVRHQNLTHVSRDPLDIAKERYAKGEITKDELSDIKKELKV